MKFFSILVLFVCFTVSIYADGSYRPEDCFLPVTIVYEAMCLIASRTVWRWDVKTRSCVTDMTHGCTNTKNNFKTEDECNEIAKPVCEKLLANYHNK
ncbi:unnamed protein product [Diabrotica balteata]|uniref:BPTI/Kunitz inhibitor domain-containing protein n=1 Tax=Diabrotica balteata TaxID=107213 RepID=A0A9N9T553_DIABA|nr:unnamed protein product [Diabrotica balteata]